MSVNNNRRCYKWRTCAQVVLVCVLLFNLSAGSVVYAMAGYVEERCPAWAVLEPEPRSCAMWTHLLQ
jgi:hypothetical protein